MIKRDPSATKCALPKPKPQDGIPGAAGHTSIERLNYSGGTIALWAICKSISKKNEANDIYKLNRELHKFSEDSLSKFPKECLNATFASLGMNDDEILGIDYFINTKHENPQKAYVDLFELTGVEYEVYGDSLVIKEQK